MCGRGQALLGTTPPLLSLYENLPFHCCRYFRYWQSYRAQLPRRRRSPVSSPLPQAGITNEPRRQACGAPDFVVQHNGVPIGYIEAKDLGKDFNADEFKEQFGRYRRSLDNLLITDYLHW